MDSLLRRSPYNLRPRPVLTSVTKKTASSTTVTAYQVDIQVHEITASAQERHEAYLDGRLEEADDPEVEEDDQHPYTPPSEGSPAKRSRMSDDRANEDFPAVLPAQARTPYACATSASNQKKRSKAHSKRARKSVRDEVAASGEHDPYGGGPIKECAKKHKYQARAIPTPFSFPRSIADPRAPVSKYAFTGKHQKKPVHAQGEVSKEAGLEERGLQLIDWDGKKTVAIVDADGNVLMVLGGSPEGYEHVLQEAERAYDEAQSKYHFKPCQKDHRRGPYPCAGCGASYGGGQQRVGNLKDTAHNRAVLDDCLLQNWAIKNLAGFVNRTFRNVAPQMYSYYGDILTRVCDDNPSLRKNFANSVFAGVTFNFGPQACTREHKDHLNIPTGWCAVVALGDFDADQGGHLIVWDLNLMIRFPRGSVIFLPSALFSHSNTVVPKGQRRYSFTQYTAGGLARWVECGFMSQKEFTRRGSKFSRTPQERWEEGVARFPKWENWSSE